MKTIISRLTTNRGRRFSKLGERRRPCSRSALSDTGPDHAHVRKLGVRITRTVERASPGLSCELRETGSLLALMNITKKGLALSREGREL